MGPRPQWSGYYGGPGPFQRPPTYHGCGTPQHGCCGGRGGGRGGCDSVQSSAGPLKVHMFRCFQKISLILCNSDIIFRITFIIKLQTSCGAIVTL